VAATEGLDDETRVAERLDVPEQPEVVTERAGQQRDVRDVRADARGAPLQRRSRKAIRGRPSTIQPSCPTVGERNVAGLDVWVLRTKRAAWTSSLSTTTVPSPAASGAAATATAASRFAGPSGPARVVLEVPAVLA
jgi:hypothetical protein